MKPSTCWDFLFRNPSSGPWRISINALMTIILFPRCNLLEGQTVYYLVLELIFRIIKPLYQDHYLSISTSILYMYVSMYVCMYACMRVQYTYYNNKKKVQKYESCRYVGMIIV